MTHGRTRRGFLCVAAGAPLALLADEAGAHDGVAPASLGRLIAQARTHPTLSQRMGFVSGALLGRRYRSNTLIGGPLRAERFVVRDDVFDCVTFCETVLAVSLARDLPEFERILRRIRYENGAVLWSERNHYFAEWSRRAVENGFCVPVRMQPSLEIDKTVNWGRQGRRRIHMAAIPRATLLAQRDRLATGDLVAFVSRRPNLDVYHTGLVVFGTKGEWMLRHASQSRRRVLDEPMTTFLAVNGVQHVTVLRPVEAGPVALRG